MSALFLARAAGDSACRFALDLAMMLAGSSCADDGEEAKLVRELAQPVVQLDLKGNVAGWNPAAARMLGWSEQEILGSVFPVPFWAAPVEGEPGQWLRLHGRRQDGRWVRMEASLAPIMNSFGHPIRILMVLSAA